MIFPEWNPTSLLAHALFAMLAAGMGISEHFNLMTMKYSKFRAGGGIPSRQGMFILYFVPLLAALGFALPYLTAPGVAQLIVLLAVCGHFLKRTIEVLFLHKYSGPMDIFTTFSIASFYTLVAAGVSYLNRWPLSNPSIWFWLGLALFIIGQAGNFYHHKLLADQRGSSGEYILPRGALFEYAACPHYLFEIIAWIGMALLSQHLFTWIALLGMSGYLLARSLKTLAWYRQKFKNYPKNRKALIPFVL